MRKLGLHLVARTLPVVLVAALLLSDARGPRIEVPHALLSAATESASGHVYTPPAVLPGPQFLPIGAPVIPAVEEWEQSGSVPPGGGSAGYAAEHHRYAAAVLPPASARARARTDVALRLLLCSYRI